MVRPPVAFILVLFVALGLAEAGHAEEPVRLVLVSIAVAGWFVFSTVVNDIADEPIDRINLPRATNRPLVAGVATRRGLLALGAGAATIAVATGFVLDLRTGLVIVAGLVLSTAYSLPPAQLSHRGAVAAILLPIGYVAVPYLSATFSTGGTLSGRSAVVMAGLSVGFIGRILLKDFRDIRGDAHYGKRTFLVRHGQHPTCVLSAICWIVGTTPVIVVGDNAIVAAALIVDVACAVRALWLLSGELDPVRQTAIIGSIAVIGRGMILVLLVQLSLAQQGTAEPVRSLLIAATAIVMVGLHTSMLNARRLVPSIDAYVTDWEPSRAR